MTPIKIFMTIADFKRPKLELPNGANKLLLHSYFHDPNKNIYDYC
nr:MAG TPA: hypothetical protein [Bacteriophage sp.]